MKVYFSDFFGLSPDILESYGALDISLIADLPLFIDPFLLFNSTKPEYQQLHEQMIEYIRFLKAQSDSDHMDLALLKSWFTFSEVKQNWLGYSIDSNDGRGLGMKFARSLHANLSSVFKNFGQERITRGQHIEKLCLIKSGVGRDNVSDFTTNLIKKFLLEYTQTFANEFLDRNQTKIIAVEKVEFSYDTETWKTMQFRLPWFNNDYVLLTPEDILTKDDTWISQGDFVRRYDHIAASIPNDSLRAQLDNYFRSVLPSKPKGKDHTQEEIHQAVLKVLERFPELIDLYIRDREDHGDQASKISLRKVEKVKGIFIEQLRELHSALQAAGFYRISGDSYDEAMERVEYLKRVIESNDLYRVFYDENNEPIGKEEDLKLMYRLTWFASPWEVDSEVNNGRGPVDYKISKGSADKSLVEFKLASNSKLEQNLQNQVEVYKKANNTKKAIKVIMYFSEGQLRRVNEILARLGLDKEKSIVLIDARIDNKTSASNVKTTASKKSSR
jgi:hypothetical protein